MSSDGVKNYIKIIELPDPIVAHNVFILNRLGAKIIDTMFRTTNIDMKILLAI